MSMIFLAKGTATMGITKTDKDGNVVSHTPAQFTFDSTGGSIAVGELDPETEKPKAVDGLFGDWDAAGYLAMALKMLQPARPVNIPDFKSIILAAGKDGTDVCDYCRSCNCRDCIVKEWKEEVE